MSLKSPRKSLTLVRGLSGSALPPRPPLRIPRRRPLAIGRASPTGEACSASENAEGAAPLPVAAEVAPGMPSANSAMPQLHGLPTPSSCSQGSSNMGRRQPLNILPAPLRPASGAAVQPAAAGEVDSRQGMSRKGTAEAPAKASSLSTPTAADTQAATTPAERGNSSPLPVPCQPGSLEKSKAPPGGAEDTLGRRVPTGQQASLGGFSSGQQADRPTPSLPLPARSLSAHSGPPSTSEAELPAPSPPAAAAADVPLGSPAGKPSEPEPESEPGPASPGPSASEAAAKKACVASQAPQIGTAANEVPAVAVPKAAGEAGDSCNTVGSTISKVAGRETELPPTSAESLDTQPAREPIVTPTTAAATGSSPQVELTGASQSRHLHAPDQPHAVREQPAAAGPEKAAPQEPGEELVSSATRLPTDKKVLEEIHTGSAPSAVVGVDPEHGEGSPGKGSCQAGSKPLSNTVAAHSPDRQSPPDQGGDGTNNGVGQVESLELQSDPPAQPAEAGDGTGSTPAGQPAPACKTDDSASQKLGLPADAAAGSGRSSSPLRTSEACEGDMVRAQEPRPLPPVEMRDTSKGVSPSGADPFLGRLTESEMRAKLRRQSLRSCLASSEEVRGSVMGGDGNTEVRKGSSRAVAAGIDCAGGVVTKTEPRMTRSAPKLSSSTSVPRLSNRQRSLRSSALHGAASVQSFEPPKTGGGGSSSCSSKAPGGGLVANTPAGLRQSSTADAHIPSMKRMMVSEGETLKRPDKKLQDNSTPPSMGRITRSMGVERPAHSSPRGKAAALPRPSPSDPVNKEAATAPGRHPGQESGQKRKAQSPPLEAPAREGTLRCRGAGTAASSPGAPPTLPAGGSDVAVKSRTASLVSKQAQPMSGTRNIDRRMSSATSCDGSESKEEEEEAASSRREGEGNKEEVYTDTIAVRLRMKKQNETEMGPAVAAAKQSSASTFAKKQAVNKRGDSSSTSRGRSAKALSSSSEGKRVPMSRKEIEHRKSLAKKLTGMRLLVPGQVFKTPHIDYPAMVWKPDIKRPTTVLVKFDDKSQYWFPAVDVQKWIVRK